MARKQSPACQALGCAIREVRRQRGYSRESFAAHAGIDHSYFGAVERGEIDVPLDVIFKVADALGMNASELLCRVQP